MVRLFNHWFASNTLLQVAFDALLLFLSVVLAVAFLNRGEIATLTAVVPDALLFALTMVALNTIVGLYQRNPGRTIAQTTARIVLSLMLAVPVAWSIFTFLPRAEAWDVTLRLAVPLAFVTLCRDSQPRRPHRIVADVRAPYARARYRGRSGGRRAVDRTPRPCRPLSGLLPRQEDPMPRIRSPRTGCWPAAWTSSTRCAGTRSTRSSLPCASGAAACSRCANCSTASSWACGCSTCRAITNARWGSCGSTRCTRAGSSSATASGRDSCARWSSACSTSSPRRRCSCSRCR